MHTDVSRSGALARTLKLIQRFELVSHPLYSALYISTLDLILMQNVRKVSSCTKLYHDDTISLSLLSMIIILCLSIDFTVH